jgi:hypothetical protein
VSIDPLSPAVATLTDERRNMSDASASSEFRVTKCRAAATLLLSSGQEVAGCFFTGDSARHEERELVGDMLNTATAFFPFERLDAGVGRIVLYNLAHVVLVTLAEHEAQRVPGYEVARRHVVSLLLSNRQRIAGAVRAYLPDGRDRVSDWACDTVTFRYLETDAATLVVNVQYVTEVTEVEPA